MECSKQYAGGKSKGIFFPGEDEKKNSFPQEGSRSRINTSKGDKRTMQLEHRSNHIEDVRKKAERGRQPPGAGGGQRKDGTSPPSRGGINS